MNKIERAIQKTKLLIEATQRQLLITQTEIRCLQEHLETLEVIEANKSIPHSNPTVMIDDEHICKKRWDACEEVKKNETYGRWIY